MGGLILGALHGGTRRFAELRREVNGVSEKVLAQMLRDLERDGLVICRSLPVVPPHVEYSLTPSGRECSNLVWGLAEWIEDHLHDLVIAQTNYDQAKGATK